MYLSTIKECIGWKPGHHHSTPFLVYFGYNLIYGAIRPSARLDREIAYERFIVYLRLSLISMTFLKRVRKITYREEKFTEG